MPPLVTNFHVQKSLRKFRLVTANSIVCNWTNTAHLPSYIHSATHIAELCDDYSLTTFLNWLATKYGFPAYASRIHSGNQSVKPILQSWPCLSDEYPLANSEQIHLLDIDPTEAILILNSELPTQPNLLSVLYEQLSAEQLVIDSDGQPHLLSNTDRRNTGLFYTPLPVVTYCLQQSIATSLPDILLRLSQSDSTGSNAPEVFRMLDPSCGAGNFLTGALCWFQEQGASDTQQLNLLKHGLYGKDIDGKAVSLCRLILLLLISHQLNEHCAKHGSQSTNTLVETLVKQLKKHIVITDSLLHAADDSYQALDSFDLVATNPPYVSYGSRNQSKPDMFWSRYLRNCYPDSTEYKIRLHSIFQDIALRYAKDDGQVALLLPDAFLTGRFYRRLRHKLLKSCQIESLTELPEKTITGATVGRWCVAVYRKTAKPDSQYKVKLYGYANQNVIDNFESNPQKYELPITSLVSKDQFRFRLLFNSVDSQIWTAIDQLKPLSTQLKGHTGIRGLHGQKTIIAQQRHDPTWQKGLISGNSVSRHRVDWNGSWIKIQPEVLYGGGYDPEIIAYPKLLVRQTGDAIVAALDSAGFYHLNNIHSFSSRKLPSDCQADLRYFDGIMNSHLWLYLYRTKSREKGRALAQIDIEMVESMPLPNPDDSLPSLVISLVSMTERLTRLLTQNRKTSNTVVQKHLSFSERAIDSLVYRLYRLSVKQQSHIEESCVARHAGQLPDMEEIIRFTQEVDDIIPAGKHPLNKERR